MDYAKYAYLKAVELEDKLASASLNNQSNGTLEFSNPILNMVVNSSTVLVCGKAKLLGNVYMQDNLIVTCTNATDINLQILADGVPVVNEKRSLRIGENQLILLKSFEPVKLGECEFSLKVSILTQNGSCTITANTLALWGDIKESKSINEINMRALKLSNNVLFSYNERGNIYACLCAVSEKSFIPSDFTFVASGVSHCFAKSNKTDDVYFFRVDSLGNLYYSLFQEVLSEMKIDAGVSAVFARECPESFSDEILITYIKNGRPFYRTFSKETVSSESKLNVPAGTYINISIADAPELKKMFVICTHSSLSNYIMLSQEDSNLSQFVENISGTYGIVINRYVNLSPNNEKFIENLVADYKLNVMHYLIDYEKYLADNVSDKLTANINFAAGEYVYESKPEIYYKLVVDQLIADGGHDQVTYAGDCADYLPAEFEFINGNSFDDKGWNERWPFNEIKPCLVLDGQVIGYLQRDDYTKFEDGSDADITNQVYDVMIQFPKIYYKLSSESDGDYNVFTSTKADITIEICNKLRSGFVCHSHTRYGIEYDYIYVNAYNNKSSSSGILGCSGIDATSTITHFDVLANLDTLKGPQYSTFNYHTATLIQILTVLLFKNMNSFDALGYGFYTTITYPRYSTNGIHNDKGMFYGVSSPTDITSKHFGLENLLGGRSSFVDGVLCTLDHKFLIWDPTNEECTINIIGDGYKVYDTKLTNNNNYGFVSICNAQNDIGLLPKSIVTPAYMKKYRGSNHMVVNAQMYSHYDSADIPNMIFYFGGLVAMINSQSIFGLFPAYDINPTKITQSERLICYPSNKKSI